MSPFSSLSEKYKLPWEPGKVLLDEFTVERQLGAGGMGVVYPVISRMGENRFAVKRILPKFVHNETLQHNFIKELQTWIISQSTRILQHAFSSEL